MVVVRFIFGVGEAGAFPIATRSLSRWMLPAERGFAQGITHAGSRLGAAITPPLVVWMILLYWLALAVSRVCWTRVGLVRSLVLYYRDTPEQHRGVNAAELDLIQSTTGGPRQQVGVRVPWRRILSSRTVWQPRADVFLLPVRAGRLPGLVPNLRLNSHRGFDLKQMGFYASLPLLAGTLGDRRLRLALLDLFLRRKRQRHVRCRIVTGHRRLHHRRRGYPSRDSHARSETLRRV